MPAFVNPHKYPQGLLSTAGNDLQIKIWNVSDRQELELACMLDAYANMDAKYMCHKDSISYGAFAEHLRQALMTSLLKVYGNRWKLSLYGLGRSHDQDLGHVGEFVCQSSGRV
mmetsp:Transcript_35076/g.79337  ORF Transcript_35076/g.79337 Transcript_35076/m.79337 type:complete len:113 (+) Transcript_35076:1917-2255(+)